MLLGYFQIICFLPEPGFSLERELLQYFYPSGRWHTQSKKGALRCSSFQIFQWYETEIIDLLARDTYQKRVCCQRVS